MFALGSLHEMNTSKLWLHISFSFCVSKWRFDIFLINGFFSAHLVHQEGSWASSIFILSIMWLDKGVFFCSAAKALYFILPLLVLVASVKLLYFAVESRILWWEGRKYFESSFLMISLITLDRCIGGSKFS